jgi:L-ascorbate metabolism protein UlaG (beta-lactamase superfamily)
MIQGSKTVYFDPYGVPANAPRADIVLTTHPHLDNYSLDNINQIMDDDATLLLTHDSDALNKHGHVIPVKPDQTLKVDGITIKTVPAYNLESRFHPKENNWVGYIIEMDGLRYYHSGDTDLIPEMSGIGDIDVAFLPVGGIYTMDVSGAIEAVKIIRPKVAIPIHFGMITGTYDDAEEFVSICPAASTILKVTR